MTSLMIRKAAEAYTARRDLFELLDWPVEKSINPSNFDANPTAIADFLIDLGNNEYPSLQISKKDMLWQLATRLSDCDDNFIQKILKALQGREPDAFMVIFTDAPIAVSTILAERLLRADASYINQLDCRAHNVLTSLIQTNLCPLILCNPEFAKRLQHGVRVLLRYGADPQAKNMANSAADGKSALTLMEEFKLLIPEYQVAIAKRNPAVRPSEGLECLRILEAIHIEMQYPAISLKFQEKRRALTPA